jgi:uncharacterized protein (DUF2336 family)
MRDAVAQAAIARGPDLEPGAIAALAEIGQREAVLALIGNRRAALPDALGRILSRFGADAAMREALLERPSLSAGMRAQIVVETAKDLSVPSAQWLPRERAERIAREARDQAAIASIASSCPGEERTGLVRALRVRGADAGFAAPLAARRGAGLVRSAAGGPVRACRCRASRPLSSPRAGNASPRWLTRRA